MDDRRDGQASGRAAKASGRAAKASDRTGKTSGRAHDETNKKVGSQHFLKILIYDWLLKA